jgi:hypothetical protein
MNYLILASHIPRITVRYVLGKLSTFEKQNQL